MATRTIIKPRRDTTANWVANNPILKDGEIAIEKVSDSNLVKIKIGDGTTAWNDLPVAADFPSIAAAETACANYATAAATSATQAANIAKLYYLPSTTYITGSVVYGAPGLPLTLVLVAKNGGTTAASAPSFSSAVVNTQVVDNTVTWMVKNAYRHMPIINKSAAYALNDYELESMVVLAGSTAYTLTLPAPTTAGHSLLIRNSGTVAMTLSTPSGIFDGPNGSATATMSLPVGVVTGLLSDGTNWVVERYMSNHTTQNLGVLSENTVIDCSKGNTVVATVGASLTFSFINPDKEFTLILTNGGNYTIVWPSNIQWDNYNVPSLSCYKDVLQFVTPDNGITWYGSEIMRLPVSFTRDSIAFKEDGTEVAAGIPRLGSSGLKIEKAITNLLYGIAYLSYSGATFTRTDGQLDNLGKNNASHLASTGGSDVLKILTDVGSQTSGNYYTMHGWFKNVSDNILTLFSNQGNLNAIIPNDSQWHEATWVVLSNGYRDMQIQFKAASVDKNVDCYVAYAQYEEGQYATSFVPQSRSVEQIAIPANCLNAQQGEIQFDWIPINGFNDYSSAMYSGGYATPNSFMLRVQNNSSPVLNLLAQGNTNSGWTLGSATTLVISKDTKYRIALTWKNSNSFCLSINGTEIITDATMSDSFSALSSLIFGYDPNINMQDECISNLRVSNTFHTTAQRQADALLSVLPILTDTTCYLPMTQTLGI